MLQQILHLLSCGWIRYLFIFVLLMLMAIYSLCDWTSCFLSYASLWTYRIRNKGFLSCLSSVESGATISKNYDLNDLPGPPSKPQVTDVTKNSVTLSWQPGTPGNLPATAYIIEAFRYGTILSSALSFCFRLSKIPSALLFQGYVQPVHLKNLLFIQGFSQDWFLSFFNNLIRICMFLCVPKSMEI